MAKKNHKQRYDEAISYISEPMLPKTDQAFSLKTVAHAYDILKKPLWNTPTFLVAGTNGKGSVCGILYTLLQQRGLSAGLYTSPHLHSFAERCQYSQHPISEEDLYDHVLSLKTKLPTELFGNLSAFERLTLASFLCIASHNPDVVVIEVGLGGDQDATNVVLADISIITSIGYDHTAILGKTLSQIATKKAAIRRPNAPLLLGKGCLRPSLKSFWKQLEHRPLYVPSSTILDGLREYFQSHSWPAYLPQALPRSWRSEHAAPFLKKHVMLENLALAVQALCVFEKHKNYLSFAHLLQHTPPSLPASFRGRGEVWQIHHRKNAHIYLDVAHNSHAMEHAFAHFEHLRAQMYNSSHQHSSHQHSSHQDHPKMALLSLLADKDVPAILTLAQTTFDRIILFYHPSPRCLHESSVELGNRATSHNNKDNTASIVWCHHFKEAFELFCHDLGDANMGYVGGCFAAVRRVMNHLAVTSFCF